MQKKHDVEEYVCWTTRSETSFAFSVNNYINEFGCLKIAVWRETLRNNDECDPSYCLNPVIN